MLRFMSTQRSSGDVNDYSSSASNFALRKAYKGPFVELAASFEFKIQPSTTKLDHRFVEVLHRVLDCHVDTCRSQIFVAE